ncbi:MAG TPA: hypothetical protein VJH37_00230 [Candidatus Nanoarchaeia archaeon]|nr:hypothetical protein [Candidatus Nanoarchaeia archaeon]
MNKKGFVRTLEAIIAAIIVLGIILVVTPEKAQQRTGTPENVKEAQQFILEGIAMNETFRDCILRSTVQGECNTVCVAPADIDAFVAAHTPPLYGFRCEICNSASTCSESLPLDKSLYTDSRLIARNPARIIRLIFWEK